MAAVAVVPAAGRSARFGSAKLLAPLGGERLIDRTLNALFAGGVDRVVVVTAPGADLASAARLGDPRVVRVVNPDPSRGMFSSIQAGLAAAAGDPVLVLPADMPFVSPATVRAVADACVGGDAVVAPTYQGRRGHPVAFPAALVPRLLAEAPASNLKAALTASAMAWRPVDVDDPGILRDVDTPADLPGRPAT